MKTSTKMTLKKTVFLLVILNICLSFGQNPDLTKRVVIDVGHGGFDPGAIGIHKIQEKEIVLGIAKDLIRLNKTIFNNSLDLYLTRYSDTFISLKDRSRLAKTVHADLFLSLHCNASKTNSNGLEIYVHNSPNLNTKESINLGMSIMNESIQKLGFRKRGIKSANFQVLRDMATFCPAVLIEIGFVTNIYEANYFLKPEHIKACAMAILIGLLNYLDESY